MALKCLADVRSVVAGVPGMSRNWSDSSEQSTRGQWKKKYGWYTCAVSFLCEESKRKWSCNGSMNTIEIMDYFEVGGVLSHTLRDITNSKHTTTITTFVQVARGSY